MALLHIFSFSNNVFKPFFLLIVLIQDYVLTLYQTIPTFKDPTEEASENTVEKGENAGNQHFLLFQQCFLLDQREKLSF